MSLREFLDLAGGEVRAPSGSAGVPQHVVRVGVFQILSLTLCQEAQGSGGSGRQVYGRGGLRRRGLRQLREIAGREVRQIRASERSFREEVRCSSVFRTSLSQGVEMVLQVFRKVPDYLELQRITGFEV